MRPRKKIWLRVSDRELRGEWRFILEDVWMFRVVSVQPTEFHLALTSRDLHGDRLQIRDNIRDYFAKKGPKVKSRKLAAKMPAREGIGVDAQSFLEQKPASRRA